MFANLIGFTFRFSFWVFFDSQIMNFIWKYVFLVIQNLRAKFIPQRSLKYCFYFENSRSFKWVNSCKLWQMRLKKKDQSSQDYGWITFWWLFNAGRQKQIPQISTRVKKKIQLFTTWTTSSISNSNAPMRILFLSRRFPARSPRIRHRSELTERYWGNAVRGQGKCLLIFTCYWDFAVHLKDQW